MDYVRMLRSRGPALPVQYFFQNHLFDLRNGTDTHRRLDATEYVFRPEEFERGIWYVCSPTDMVRGVLTQLGERLGESFRDYQFFDLGCGKGKALLVYGQMAGSVARNPAVGIEYYAPLAAVAESNIRVLCLHQACSIHCADARKFPEWAASDKLILFLYNPFDGEILREVLSRAREFAVYVIYLDPAHHRIVMDLGFTVVLQKSGMYPNRCITVYSYLPDGSTVTRR